MRNIFEPSPHRQPQHRVTEDDLRQAFEARQLSLRYQPKIEAESGKLAGVEALARWEHPKLGWIEPAIFIPLAEKTRLIEDLTQWGLECALSEWANWRERGLTTQLSFNISALSLDDLNFPDRVEKLCENYEVPTRYLTLELTESATQEAALVADTLTRFRIKGMSLALDDFGTGYSSLVQLRRLPFTELKIDRCFVEDIEQAEDSRMIVRSLVVLAHAMGMSTTAEGVKGIEGLSMLAAYGCDQVQGNFVSEPLPASEVPDWSFDLAKQSSAPPQ